MRLGRSERHSLNSSASRALDQSETVTRDPAAEAGLVGRSRDSSGQSAALGRPLKPPVAALLGWLVVALWNAVGIARIPLSPRGSGIRLAHHATDLGHVLAIGLSIALLVALWRRAGARRSTGLPRRWAIAAIAGLSAGVSQITLRADLANGIERIDLFSSQKWVLPSACAALSLAVPASFLAGVWLRQAGLRVLGLALGLGCILGNDFVLVSGYPGLHVLIATCGSTLLGTSLCGVRLPFLATAFPLRTHPRAWKAMRPALWGSAAIAAAASLILTPASSVRVELLRRDTALLFPWIHPLYDPARIGKVTIPPELRQWFQSREGRADLPPNSASLLPRDPIVIVVTIDALRMEVFEPKYRHVAPNLHRIRENSVYFSQARSSGSDTRYSLAALFTGRHYSMLRWSPGKRQTLKDDTHPRLPELLEKGGVRTVNFVALEKMLIPSVGIVRGFSEQFDYVPTERPRTEQIVDQAIERLRRHRSGPLFFYTHLIDPHAPYYTYGKHAATKHDAYLMEVSLSDANLGRLRRAIVELGLKERTALIIGSDHGEGFGEHGIFHHNKTLYEVMVHVPLMLEIPGVKPRVVDQFVSLMDIGPTVLDLFGIPTPGHWVSESLLPFLIGGRTEPTRPFLMEKAGREKAMLFPDGLKLLVRGGTEEMYDIRKDPEETDNLRDAHSAEAERRVMLLKTYLEVHSRGSSDDPQESPAQ